MRAEATAPPGQAGAPRPSGDEGFDVGGRRARIAVCSETRSASLTLSYLFWEGSTTPYAGGGGGWVRETTTFSGQSADAAGPAFVAEAGWMFLRDERWLRMSAGLQAIVPLFSADKPSMFRDSPAFPLLGLNLRLML